MPLRARLHGSRNALNDRLVTKREDHGVNRWELLVCSVTGHATYSHDDRALARAPALLISRLVSWVDDLWCRAIGAGV
ncbi:hypothetical protein CKW46_03470 [Mycobacterium liflandii]|nr:hypothetical protein BB170200_04783 [Mycobacterium marinum]ULL08988.1 hypothetical protein CKW46_03470 [Mycobacterium liflandii]